LTFRVPLFTIIVGPEGKEPGTNTMDAYLKELFKRKDLLIYLVTSGLKAQYRNTFLGYLWWILDPLLMGAVYYFLRVVVLGMEGEYIGAFLITGLIAWHWINSSLKGAASSITGRSRIITQVYLPKAIFPFGVNLTQTINFTFGLVVVAIFLAAYQIVPGSRVLWLPVIMAVQFIFLAGLSLAIAYLCMFIRDIDNVLAHVMRIWFWGTPVIWETGRLDEQYHFIFDINPAAILLISYRNVLIYNAEPELGKLALIGALSVILTLYMVRFYHLNEHKIIKAL